MSNLSFQSADKQSSIDSSQPEQQPFSFIDNHNSFVEIDRALSHNAAQEAK